MELAKEHVVFILAEFDAGISPNQILTVLQYSGSFPGIDIKTIEKYLLEFGRLQISYQTANAVQGNLQLGVGHNNPPLPANTVQGSPPLGADHNNLPLQANQDVQPSSALTREARQLSELISPPPTKDIDPEAIRIAFDAYKDGKSGDEIWLLLRARGFNIAREAVPIIIHSQGVGLSST